MKRARFSLTATTLLLLLVSVCLIGATAQAQPNITGQWNTSSFQMPINPVHMALMNTGKVLVVSGSGNVPGNLAFQSGVWDPVSGSFTTLGGSWDMFCNGITILPDGRALIAGGTIQYNPFLGARNAALFDPIAGTLTDLALMQHGRWYPTAITLSDGRALVYSGINETGPTNLSIEFFHPISGWSAPLKGSWAPPLYPRLHVLPNGKVFYSGPTINSNLFDPSTNTWTLKVATHNYPNPRTYGSSVLLPLTPANNYSPKIMIFGGGNTATATTELIDLSSATPSWQFGPNMSQARVEMNAVMLPTGKILALGGSAQDENAKTASLKADLYDPNTNTFSSAGANAFPRLYHSNAMLLPDATVAVAGSNPVRGTYEPHVEIYQPAYLFTTDTGGNPVLATRPTIAGSPATVSYGSTFTVQTPDADTISSVVLIRASAVTHSFDMDQRLVGVSFAAIPNTGGPSTSLSVTAPPSGSIAPPGYYLLFLLNNAGVPSVANFVQLSGPPDFTFSVAPATKTVNDGAAIAFTARVTPAWNYSGQVTLGVSGLPAGAVGTFSPLTSGSSTLTITKTQNAVAGSYPLTLTATDGTITHTTSAVLNLNSFSLSESPGSQALAKGSSTVFTVTVTPAGTFNGVINFRLPNLPVGVTGTFTPTTVTGSGSTTLTLSAATTAASKTSKITINGVSGNMTRPTSVSITVQ
jgi:Domain of unknown function (DUF1929)